MQYRDELIAATEDVYRFEQDKKNKILNQVQMHAIKQLKEGYTGFRISRLKREDEIYLKEWADITNANIKMIRFKCFENQKRYAITQFVIDLKDSLELNYELEGKTLHIEY